MRKTILSTLILVLLLVTNTMYSQINKSNQKVIDKIKKYLIASEKNGLNGAVLIAKGNDILLNEGYGMANKEQQIKNTPQTVFKVGSVTKQFTAAAILKLEEQGKLKVEDFITKYFKDVPEDKKTINIHQLLTHTAGFVHDIGETDFDNIPTDEYFRRALTSKLLFKAGLKHEYTNVGYSLLARIIELASGQTYEAYLRENLFKPAGMYYTGYVLPNWSNLSIANGYIYNVINKGTSLDIHKKEGMVSWCLKGNGGIHSTQNDMYKWYQALISGKVLSKKSIEKLTKPYVLEYEGETSYYAYGWAIFKTVRGTKTVTHDGSDGTFFYDFRWFPEENITILYATNSYTRSNGEIPWIVDKMLFDVDYTPKEIKADFMTALFEFTKKFNGNQSDLTREVKSKFSKQLTSPSYLNRLSSIYARNNRMDIALPMAELNTILFPKNDNIWDTMGEIYYKNSYIDKAIKAYQKAINLNPKNTNAIAMVKKLQEKN
ncbi:serine hydrolase domain-containing protein [Flavivirga rizhaonensis]|uniref:Serine hydrolase n=1 Tax=Flavivirga rizhaonensis TaxID=2559571 RepID=A0A4S1E412_9FLAO|nr:serine hydrolase domain-containing protein [Flavivirga rizhaonensis]TGV04732.1 serine hydrolase [Flavivirga rizhaonensis]